MACVSHLLSFLSWNLKGWYLTFTQLAGECVTDCIFWVPLGLLLDENMYETLENNRPIKHISILKLLKEFNTLWIFAPNHYNLIRRAMNFFKSCKLQEVFLDFKARKTEVKHWIFAPNVINLRISYIDPSASCGISYGTLSFPLRIPFWCWPMKGIFGCCSHLPIRTVMMSKKGENLHVITVNGCSMNPLENDLRPPSLQNCLI